MIVSFSVSNFRSFASEETLSLVASKRFANKHKNHLFPIPGSKEDVLKAGVIYGANGAGKSNLFKALRFLQTVALINRSRGTGTGREVFKFSDELGDASTFDLQFITNEKLYRFGLTVDDKRIVEEWLVEVNGNKEKPLYERTTDPEGVVTVEAKHLKNASKKLKALITVAGRQNNTFLATVRTTLDESEITDELQSIIHWLRYELTLIAPDESFGPLGPLLADEPKFLQFAGDFLNASSTGVDHLLSSKKEISEKELISLLSVDVASKVMEDLLKDDGKPVLISLGEGKDLLVERDEENRFYQVNIQAVHEHKKGEVVPLDLAQESDGTLRLLNLIPALHDLQYNNAVYFIDEIDRSMHPMLVVKFMEFFLESCKEGNKQVIVTTHESNLLDLDLLRRDEIWFAEKDQAGATRIYSLSDYGVRQDLDIQKHYLIGRFGAVPFLGNIDQLLEDHECSD